MTLSKFGHKPFKIMVETGKSNVLAVLAWWHAQPIGITWYNKYQQVLVNFWILQNRWPLGSPTAVWEARTTFGLPVDPEVKSTLRLSICYPMLPSRAILFWKTEHQQLRSYHSCESTGIFQPGGKQAFHDVPEIPWNSYMVTCMAASPEVA